LTVNAVIRLNTRRINYENFDCTDFARRTWRHWQKNRFLIEDELQKNGGNYSKGADWLSYSVRDGNLITGQNPASSEAVAKEVLDQL
jgi:putative intracellular protease/amidase